VTGLWLRRSLLVLAVLSAASGKDAGRLARIPGIDPGACNPGPGEKPWLDRNQTPGCRALEVIARMTLEEKLAEAGGITGRSANGRLGLVAGGGSDGPNGIATMGSGPPQPRGRNVTAFPDAVTLSATWDRELAGAYGRALGEEFAGKGLNSVLGPTINIMRTWRWGRNGETLSEDPYLTAEMAVEEIKALNSQRVLTVVKHYAGNNQENSRCGVLPDNAGIDARITEKALHEIYLPGFKAAVVRAGTGGIMCSYNQVNGKYACNNPQLLGTLRSWGFDGFIAPDAAFAMRDPLTAALAGVTRVGGKELAALVQANRLAESDIDRMLYYDLTPYFRLGIFDAPAGGRPEADVSTPEHQALARRVAEEGAVLLQNRGNVLPLVAVRSIAIIGDDAGPQVTIGLGGSGHVYASRVSEPAEAIRKRAGSSIRVTYARGTPGIGPLETIPAAVLAPESGEGQGLLARYFPSADANGLPTLSRVEPCPHEAARPQPENPPAGPGQAPARRTVWSARWTGSLLPPANGSYLFSITGAGTAELYVDHKPIAVLLRADFGQTVQGSIDLKAGRPVPLELKYSNASAILGPGLSLGWHPPDPDMLSEAVSAAKGSDVAVVFVAEQMGEGQDKTTLGLPGDQDRLIREVARANPKTVVVLHNSNPVSMPWLDQVAAVVEAFYPGQEAGTSLAHLLFGDGNPSGRLPMTFPAGELQGPATHFMDYPGDGMTVHYSEGVLVGYRYYDARGQEPLFPFGHGLSYTAFRYGKLEIDETRDGGLAVRVQVTNVGKREGSEVVQLYLACPAEAGEPPKQLKQFQKIRLKPGESKTVAMSVGRDGLAAWDAGTHAWRAYPGTYSVLVGSSSRDIRLKGSFTLRQEASWTQADGSFSK